MIKLSKEIVATLATSVTNNSSVERSDKELFLSAYKEYKGTTKAQRGHITNLLNVEVTKLTKSINVQNTLKRVFKLAHNYIDMQIICKFDNLEYTNISKLVKLFKYVDKNITDKSTELREDIFKLYEPNMSPHRYNNIVADKITELKEQYKLKEVDGEYKVLSFNDMYHTIEKSLEAYDEAQVDKLMQLLQDRLDIVEAQRLEVA